MADDPKKTAEEIAAAAEAAGVAAEKIAQFAMAMEESADRGTAIKNLLEEINSLSEQQTGTNAQRLEQDIERIALLNQILGLAQQTNSLTEEEVAAERRRASEKEKINALLQQELSNMERAKSNLIGQNKETLTLRYHFAAIEDIWTNMSREEALNRIINTAVDSMASFTNAIVAASLEFDKVAASVAKATSTTQFAGAMEDLRVEALAAGASVEELGQNFITLNNNFTDFNRIDAESAKQLAATTTALNAAGFSAEAFAKTLDLGTKALGMSTGQVETFSKELVNFGKSAGIPMERLSKDLAAIGPQLATFGAQGTKVFKEMSLASKNLGIELGRMFSIAEQYTTFEGAANAAAKLNSVLGGNFINSLDLMNASLEDPVESFRLMKESMDASGKSFDDMTPAMKRVIAEAAGFSDVSEAARIFNMDITEGSDALEEQAITQEKLNEMNRSFISLQEKLNKLMAQFTPIIMPVIDGLGKIVDYLSELSVESKQAIFWIGVVSASFMGLLLVGGFILTFIAKLGIAWSLVFGKKNMEEAAEGLNKVGEGTKSLGEKLKETAEAVKGTWREMLAFGGAVLLVGAGIAVASLGLAELVKSFGELTGEQILGGLASLLIVLGGFAVLIKVLAASLITFSVAGSAAALPLLAFGAAIMLIGAGIGLAASGMAQLVTSLGAAGDNATQALLAIVLLSGAIVGLGFALMELSTIGAAGAGVLVLIGTAAMAIGYGIKLATEGIAMMLSELTPTVDAMSLLIDKLDNLDLEKVQALAGISALAATPVAIGTAAPNMTVENIVVRNPIRDEAGTPVADSKPINISLTVPVKIDGSQFEDVVVGIAKGEIKVDSENKRTINLVP